MLSNELDEAEALRPSLRGKKKDSPTSKLSRCPHEASLREKVIHHNKIGIGIDSARPRVSVFQLSQLVSPTSLYCF